MIKNRKNIKVFLIIVFFCLILTNVFAENTEYIKQLEERIQEIDTEIYRILQISDSLVIELISYDNEKQIINLNINDVSFEYDFYNNILTSDKFTEDEIKRIIKIDEDSFEALELEAKLFYEEEKEEKTLKDTVNFIDIINPEKSYIISEQYKDAEKYDSFFEYFNYFLSSNDDREEKIQTYFKQFYNNLEKQKKLEEFRRMTEGHLTNIFDGRYEDDFVVCEYEIEDVIRTDIRFDSENKNQRVDFEPGYTNRYLYFNKKLYPTNNPTDVNGYIIEIHDNDYFIYSFFSKENNQLRYNVYLKKILNKDNSNIEPNKTYKYSDVSFAPQNEEKTNQISFFVDIKYLENELRKEDSKDIVDILNSSKNQEVILVAEITLPNLSFDCNYNLFYFDQEKEITIDDEQKTIDDTEHYSEISLKNNFLFSNNVLQTEVDFDNRYQKLEFSFFNMHIQEEDNQKYGLSFWNTFKKNITFDLTYSDLFTATSKIDKKILEEKTDSPVVGSKVSVDP